MSIEIQPKTNLLSSFSQTKINYQQPQFIPAQPPISTVQPQEKPVLQNQPTKDEFVNSELKADTQKSNTFKDFTLKYGGVLTGTVALATSVIGLPLVYKKGKNANGKVLNEIKDSLDTLSKKIKNLDLEDQIKAAVEEVVKGSNAPTNVPVSKQSILTTALLGIGTGVGITEFLKDNKKEIKEQGFTDDEIKKAQDTATAILEKPTEAINKANAVYSMAEDAKRIAEAYDSRINVAVENSRDAVDAAGARDKQIMNLFLEPFYDLRLLSVRDWDKKIDINKSQEAFAIVNNAAVMRLDRSADDTIKDIKNFKEKYPQLNSLWGMTSEYDPIKKGGLGVVPSDLQDNFVKLGMDSPTFIPMYLKKGLSEFKAVRQYNPETEKDETHYQYIYDKEKYDLKKLAEVTIPTYRNGKQLMERVEYYSTQKPIRGADKTKTLVFVKNADYFRDGIYDSTPFAEETEKFALFTKSVYTLAKYKVAEALGSDLTGVENIKIADKAAFDEIKAPNSFVLNDWHAGSVAGLFRYRAPMEYAYNELSKDVMYALKDMPLLMIGHNLGEQGNTNSGSGSLTAKNQTTENVINTLYDHYAKALAEHGHSGLQNEDICNTILMKRRTGDKQFNSLFHGAALADWFEIVSPNHAKECIDDPAQSRILWSLLQRRQHTGTIGGILNGLDKNKVDMKATNDRNFVKFRDVNEKLNLQEYDKDTPIDEVMEKRMYNKRRVYNAFIKPLIIDRNYPANIEVVNPDAGNPNISEEDFANAPVIGWAHRMSGQKGLKYFSEAVTRLFDNWDNLFPGKPMPIIIAGGPVEDSKQLQYLNDLKDMGKGYNKERISRTIALKNNLPNPAIMSACTFFTGPSDYEPCGLIQGECFAKGTPVIATDVGGFHDTIKDGETGFLAKYPSTDAVYDKMVEALKMYFYDHDKYKQMVANDLQVDFSWNQPGKQGSIFEYTDKLGFDRESLPEVATAA